MRNERTNDEKLKLLIEVAFRAILDNTEDMMFIKDANLCYVAASMPFVKMVGKQNAEEIIGRTDLDIFDDENLARRYIADDRKLIARGDNLINYIEPITDEDGHPRYGSTSKYLFVDHNGQFMGLLGVTRDITRDYIAKQHYQQELTYLFKLPPDTYAVSYMDVDEWRIISQRKQKIEEGTIQSCYTVESLVEAAQMSIVDRECEAAEFYHNCTKEYLKEIYASGRIELSFTYRRKLGENIIRWVHNEVRFLTDAENGHLCVMFTAKDVEAKKREEEKLVMAAQMDKMTMVLNRETAMEYIREALDTKADYRHALFMIDVDNFKNLNDTLGHQTGDEFLIAMAGEIKNNFRNDDVVGRIGGDEFFVLMKNVADMPETQRKAQELLTNIRKVCDAYESAALSVSMGISLYPDNGKSLEELYAKADETLYEAKHKGKNQFVFATV